MDVAVAILFEGVRPLQVCLRLRIAGGGATGSSIKKRRELLEMSTELSTLGESMWLLHGDLFPEQEFLIHAIDSSRMPRDAEAGRDSTVPGLSANTI